MKKAFFLIFIFCCIGLNIFADNTQNPDVIPMPNPSRLLVDNANLLSSEEQAALESKLVAFDDTTSNQICVVIVSSLNDRILEDVATATFRAWGIGDKKTNNGVLLLISFNDRKIRIEVGYGLEGAIPDIVCGEIIKNDIAPAFRAGSYYNGIDQAVSDLEKAAAGEYHIEKDKDNGVGSGIGGLIPLIIILIILFSGRGNGLAKGIIIGSLLNGSGRSDGGGWSSGGGGGFGGFGGGSSGGGGASGGW